MSKDIEVSGDTIFECLSEIKKDVVQVKTDVAWLKRIVIATVVVMGGLLGIDTSGVLG